MKISTYELLAIAEHAGIDEEDVRTDYSGRGMFGSSCVGIVGAVGDLARFVFALGMHSTLALTEEEPAWDEWSDVREDSMGTATIFYFPQVEAAVPDGHRSSDHDWLMGRSRP